MKQFTHKNELTISDLKPGDMVLVTRKAKSNEDKWKNAWAIDMDISVGKILRVHEIPRREESGIELEDGIGNFYYPIHILEKV